jgi:hypothetical protein
MDKIQEVTQLPLQYHFITQYEVPV